MIKAKLPFFIKTGKILALLFNIIQLITFTAVIILAVFLWQRPQYIYEHFKTEDKTEERNDKLSLHISVEIKNINRKIEVLESVGKIVTENADLLKQQFVYFDKSKADSSEILNISNRINTISNKVDKIGAVSNSGALILTAAMLIRDNVTNGLKCQNEAEALKILAEGIDSMNENIDFITSHCKMDFYTKTELIKQFNDIYDNIGKSLTSSENNDWKKRLISKIDEYIKISNSDNDRDYTHNTIENMKSLKILVNKGDFISAVRMIENSENTLSEIEEINAWCKQVKNQADFNKSLSEIIANSLLIMKVENATEKTQQ